MSRSRLLFAVCALVAVYFVYTALVGAFRTHQLSSDREEAKAEVLTLEQKKTHLEAVRNYVASDAYVEQEARRRLGFIRPGEVAFVVLSPSLESPDRPRGEWWERLFPR